MLPALGAGLQVVQPVANVGEHTVDVEHGESSRSASRFIQRAGR